MDREFISSNSIVRLQNPGVVSRQLLNPENSSSERLTITELLMKVLDNPEMAALLTSLAKTMKV